MRPRLVAEAVTRLRAPLVTDRYGNEIPDWDAAVPTVLAGVRVDPATTVETYDPIRNMVVTRWRLTAPPGTDLLAADRVTTTDGTLEVDGDLQRLVSPRNRLGHVTAMLKAVGG